MGSFDINLVQVEHWIGRGKIVVWRSRCVKGLSLSPLGSSVSCNVFQNTNILASVWAKKKKASEILRFAFFFLTFPITVGDNQEESELKAYYERAKAMDKRVKAGLQGQAHSAGISAGRQT